MLYVRSALRVAFARPKLQFLSVAQGLASANADACALGLNASHRLNPGFQICQAGKKH